MPKLDLDEIRGLSEGELTARADELREEQFRLKFRAATETLEEPLRLRTVRRDIARVLTVLREKQLGVTNTPPRQTAPASTPKAASKKPAAKKSAAKKTTAKKAATKKTAATKQTETKSASEGTAKRATKRTTKTAR
jgi:large subunit ribosomal protein L29